MLYSRRTINLMKRAVEKWELIANSAGEDKDCALCDMFGYRVNMGGKEGCFGCPIYDFTGADCTEVSPYKEWHKYWSSQYIGTLRPTMQIENLETQELAYRELEFVRKIFVKALLLWDIVEEYCYRQKCLDYDRGCKDIKNKRKCHAYTPYRGYCPYLQRKASIVKEV